MEVSMEMVARVLAACLTLLAPPAGGRPPESREPSPATAELARAAFDRFRSLAGDWEAASTKGWTESIGYRTIAGGSVVLETSFGAHPNETMATAFQMDGDRLLLTHYCVAGNTPRLEATAFEDGGRTVIFSFRDAVNLPTRDRGHMDRAVFVFESPDRVRSRWTWFANGSESWMEEIVQTRRR
jgi:hypothetical protein